MNRSSFIGACLAVCLIMMLAASLVQASEGNGDGGVLTVSQTFTLEDLKEHLPVVHFALHNPFYQGRLKVYRGFYLADLIRFLTSAEDGIVYFEALDGYRVQMEIGQVFEDTQNVGVVAFEEVGMPGGFEPVSYGGRHVEELGPYWLVWGDIDPSRVADGGEALMNVKYWPWQLTKIGIEH